MHFPAIVEFFRHKVVSSIIFLVCDWSSLDRVKITRQLSHYGMTATFSCNPGILADAEAYRFQGVFYINQINDGILEVVNPEHFSTRYKWLIVYGEMPDVMHKIRYDSDVVLIEPARNVIDTDNGLSTPTVFFKDVYVHPKEGATEHPWAFWTSVTGIQLTHDRERILRRLDLKKYPIRVASPIGLYHEDWYGGSFKEYLWDETMPERDSSVRCGYKGSSILIEAINATEVLAATSLWNSLTDNDSMLYQVSTDQAQLSGAILRILNERIPWLDYVMPLCPFHVGFTYLADRESSSNMFVEPFSPGVWWCCLGIGLILAIVQRITARRPEEKEGAYIATLATFLQQDASAVPEGLSGRWSFVVLSVAAMLVHAYYTSAIVSALMSGGSSGPDTLRALGDSRYAIASQNYNYMRYLFWDVDTKWDEMEYLKKKKMTAKFYEDTETGVKLIQEGNTAFHAEYNQLYPHLKTFSDDQLCKLQQVDTIPEVFAWITAAKRGQWTSLFRARATWLHETGLAKRLVSQLRMKAPPCRSALLAERVKFGDVATLLGLTAFGAVVSCILLGTEMIVFRLTRKRSESATSETTYGVDVIQY